MLAGLTLIGYLFAVEQFFAVMAYATVALPTAIEILLLALAVAASVPSGVAWWMHNDPGAGATLVRHMLPVAVVVPPALGVLPLLGVGTDLVGERFGIAVMVTATAVVLLSVAAVAAVGSTRSTASGWPPRRTCASSTNGSVNDATSSGGVRRSSAATLARSGRSSSGLSARSTTSSGPWRSDRTVRSDLSSRRATPRASSVGCAGTTRNDPGAP